MLCLSATLWHKEKYLKLKRKSMQIDVCSFVLSIAVEKYITPLRHSSQPARSLDFLSALVDVSWPFAPFKLLPIVSRTTTRFLHRQLIPDVEDVPFHRNFAAVRHHWKIETHFCLPHLLWWTSKRTISAGASSFRNFTITSRIRAIFMSSAGSYLCSRIPLFS